MPVEIQFLRPLWFLALVPLPFLLWALARRPGGADAWRGLVDAHLLSHLLAGEGPGGRRLPLVLLGLGWLLGVTALAGPVWERLPRPVFQTEAQRVIVLDLSERMNAQDLPPSRLARSRFEVLDMLDRAAEGQTALLAYGSEPFVVSPLTKDADTIAAQVPDLETALMPVKGARRTALALEEAGGLLRRAGSLEGDIILATNSLERPDEVREVAARLRAEGYRTSVLGIGTEKGAPIPQPDGGFVTDGKGAIALSRLRPEQLRALAAAGGGRYVRLSTDDSDTRALIPERRDRVSERAAEQDAWADQWREEGPWLLLVLLPLAALAFRRGWLSPLALVVLTLPPPSADALGWEDLWWRADQQGARAFSAGEYEQAAEKFQRPDWRAAAQYEAGEYQRALDTLEAQIGTESAYNRGNAMARQGNLRGAIAQYEKVLGEDPRHEDARHNRDVLQRLLQQQQAQQRQSQSQEGQEGRDGPQNQSETTEPDGGDGQGGEREQEDLQNQGGQDDLNGQQGEGGQEGDSVEDRSGQQTRASDEKREQASTQDRQQGDGGVPSQSPQRPPSTEKPPGENPPEQAHPEQRSSESQDGPRPPDDRRRPSVGTGDREPGGEDGSRGEDQGAESSVSPESGGVPPETGEAGAEPDLRDLLGSDRRPDQGREAPGAEARQGRSEGQQAMEHMLRRVPDDPGGLLRQRFLLQHLRRSERLP